MQSKFDFHPFELERFLSIYENDADFNLSESGVHPLSLRELIKDRISVDELLDTEFFYPATNGSLQLRENIAALYSGAEAENVLVTIGAAEANFVSVHTLVQPGEEIVSMIPNYMQIFGIAKNLGANVKTFQLDESLGWAPDLEELRSAVSPKTKLIAICNPNNPTGRILSEQEMNAIVSIAESVGAWIIADEVYGGAERLTDIQTPSFWGKYDKVLAVGSLSKAYALPGLRLGWIVAPKYLVEDLWSRHDYTTIGASMLSNKLATIALSQDVRPKILNRVRKYVRKGYPLLEQWLDDHKEYFSVIPPQASAVAFVRYSMKMNSTDLVNKLMREKSVFVIPGDVFAMDNFLRISFGVPQEILQGALDRMHDFFLEHQGTR